MDNILPSDDAYPEFVNDCLRAELKRRRLALGLSLRKLAIPKKLTAQTISNIEKGTHSPSITTLALLCGRLDASVEQVTLAALL